MRFQLQPISPSPLATLHPFYETWDWAFIEDPKYLLNSLGQVARECTQGLWSFLAYSGSLGCSIASTCPRTGMPLRFPCLPFCTTRHFFPLTCAGGWWLHCPHALWISTARVFLQKKGEGLLNCQSTQCPRDRVLQVCESSLGTTLGNDLTQAWLGFVKWLLLLFLTNGHFMPF